MYVLNSVQISLSDIDNFVPRIWQRWLA